MMLGSNRAPLPSATASGVSGRGIWGSTGATVTNTYDSSGATHFGAASGTAFRGQIVSISENTPYVAFLEVQSPEAGIPLKLRIRWQTAAGGLISDFDGNTVTLAVGSNILLVASTSPPGAAQVVFGWLGSIQGKTILTKNYSFSEALLDPTGPSYSTPSPAEFDTAFRAGFGQTLMDGGVGAWNVAFGPTDVAIVDGGLPASPADAIALASYQVDDDPTLSDSTIGLQVTARADGADPRPTAQLTGKVYDLLHGMAGVVLPGGVYVVDCYRQSWTSLGQDENNRWREVSNFYVRVHRPSKYRI